MTQHKNTPGSQQTGSKTNQLDRDGNRKEINPNTPVAGKGVQKNPDSNRRQHSGAGKQQNQFGDQQHQGSPSGQSKPGQNARDEDAEEIEDKKFRTGEEVSGKKKLHVSQWSENGSENKSVKKENS